MPAPYIPKVPNDPIRAADWNAIQVLARTDIETHDHSGGPNGAQLGSASLANGAVTNAKLAALSVTSDKLAARAVTGDKLAALAVTGDKIANGTITQAKLDPNLAFGVRMLVPAGGDGQIGILGETLEIALRVRVSNGKVPIADAHVEFEVLETMFNGQPLDQYTGGSLHASFNVISREAWPNGTRTRRAVVKTDADGVAQVQRVLGTHPGLSVQRLRAVLLDESEQRTGEQTLFTAHLAIATEIGWFPNSVFSFLAPNPGNTVQSALDGIASGLARLGLGHSSITPYVVDAGEHRHALAPGYTLSVEQFAGVELQRVHDGQDPSFDPRGNSMAFTVWLDHLPVHDPHGTLYRLRGNVSSADGGRTLTWLMEPGVHDWLVPMVGVPQRIIVEFMPSALNLRGPPLKWGFELISPNMGRDD